MTEWLECTEPDSAGTVVLTAHNVWAEPPEEVIVTQALTFRRLDQLEHDLEAVGLAVRDVRGGWNGEPFTRPSALIVLTAEKVT